MAIKHIIIFALSFVLFGSVSAQQVKLSRLDRALGQDSVIISNASGVAGWHPKSSLGFLSGSGTNNYYPIFTGSGTIGDGNIYWSGTATVFDHPSGSDLYQNSTTFGYTGANPIMTTNGASFTFLTDNDTGMRRVSSDVLGFYAGDATNPSLKIDGASNFVYFDPDDDGTNDVTISATTTSVEALTASGIITADGSVRFTANSTSDNVHLVGTDASNFNTRVIVDSDDFEWGDGTTYDTLKLKAGANSYLFAYDDNVGSSQSFSLTGPGTYDTIQIAVTSTLENGVQYGAPNPSADSAIIFDYAGVYEIQLTFTGELGSATTNQSVKARWNKNSGSSVNGTGVVWGVETTARQSYTHLFVFTAAANDYLQLMATTGTGGATTLTMVTPKITVKRID